ncbi:MAG: DUF2269 family protein [Desulfobacterales bacterium]|nr:DUF2269 family protein [Desulfobacterales bacterium]
MEEGFDLIASLLKWVHVSLVISFIIGIAGYITYFYQAARETNIKVVHDMVETGDKIHKYFLLWGGILLILSGIVTALRHKVPILGFLTGGEVNWLLATNILLLTYFPLMALIFIPRHKVFHKELHNAIVKGEVTQGLRKAFAGRAIKNGHIYELSVVMVIIFLMVVKPF